MTVCGLSSVATAFVPMPVFVRPPVYVRPHYLMPASYQGSGAFRVAEPEDGSSSRGDWWTLFGDEQLNRFEGQLQRENPTLQGAAEAYTQARELAADSDIKRLFLGVGATA